MATPPQGKKPLVVHTDDRVTLMTVEDVINNAMGPTDKNLVDFKLLQLVLIMLARQLRMLQQHVDIRGLQSDMFMGSKDKKGGKKKKDKSPPTSSDTTSSSKRGKSPKKGKKGEMEEIKEVVEKEVKDKDKKEGKKKKEKKEDEDKGKSKEKIEEVRAKSADRGRPGKDDDGGHKEKGSPSRDRADHKERRPSRDRAGHKERRPSPDRAGDKTRVGSIEVVTLAEFQMLQDRVQQLQKSAGPMPMPTMPDNQQLRQDLASGSASLNDAMLATQLVARVQATEEAVRRLGEMMTQVTAGAYRPDETHVRSREGQSKAVTIDPQVAASEYRAYKDEEDSLRSPAPFPGSSPALSPALSAAFSRTSTVTAAASGVGSRFSALSRTGIPGVTHPEMIEALCEMKDNILRGFNQSATTASTMADSAAAIAKNVAERMEIAMKTNKRLSDLTALVSDYAEQLSGFDAGLVTQMSSFQEQMNQMRADLRTGLTQLEQVNSNKETMAVIELTERYEGLVGELDGVLHEHLALGSTQRELGLELKTLIERVEMLSEDKADRDEVADGLRDKADLSRLAGMLTEAQFSRFNDDLRHRLALCYDKFNKQDDVWMRALKELSDESELKADMAQMLAYRDNALQELQRLRDQLAVLALAVGEPKAALLTRLLAKDATCGVCRVPALMEPVDATYGAPPRLPALRTPPGAPPVALPGHDVCHSEWYPQPVVDSEVRHVCKRWVGGSHTLLSGPVSRAPAEPLDGALPATRRYTCFGSDGRMYMCEDVIPPCVPCMECNPDEKPDEKPDGKPAGEAQATPSGGGGDQVCFFITLSNGKTFEFDYSGNPATASPPRRSSPPEPQVQVQTTGTSHGADSPSAIVSDNRRAKVWSRISYLMKELNNLLSELTQLFGGLLKAGYECNAENIYRMFREFKSKNEILAQMTRGLHGIIIKNKHIEPVLSDLGRKPNGELKERIQGLAWSYYDDNL